MYLEKCTDLVTHLLPAFATKTGIPYGQINLATGKAQNPSWARGASTLAEFGTLQMEFIALSQRTGDTRWEQMAENIVEKVRDVKYKVRGAAVVQVSALVLDPWRGFRGRRLVSPLACSKVCELKKNGFKPCVSKKKTRLF